jgi:hypothetical protein
MPCRCPCRSCTGVAPAGMTHLQLTGGRRPAAPSHHTYTCTHHTPYPCSKPPCCCKALATCEVIVTFAAWPLSLHGGEGTLALIMTARGAASSEHRRARTEHDAPRAGPCRWSRILHEQNCANFAQFFTSAQHMRKHAGSTWMMWAFIGGAHVHSAATHLALYR